jgi:hypothetical protein
MTLHRLWIRSLRLSLALGLTLGFTLSADAKTRKHRHYTGQVWSSPYNGHRAANQNDSGPLYFAQEYLGTDPDPNIRFQLMRDITGRYGGGGD